MRSFCSLPVSTLLAAAMLTLPAIALAAPSYAVTQLPFTHVFRVHINNAGQVAGLVSDISGMYGGVWDHGRLTRLPTAFPDGTYLMVPAGINWRGTIAGWGINATTEERRAFTFSRGRVEWFGTPGMVPDAINDVGQIAGLGFLYSRGAITSLAGIEAISAINNAGTVVGTLAGSQRAALWKDGEVTLIDPSNPNRSSAKDINDAGQVVGDHDVVQADGSLASRPFLYSRGVLHDLALPAGATWGSAYAINNTGQIVGFYFGADGNPSAFVYKGGTVYKLSDLVSDGYDIMGETHDINDAGQIVAWACRYSPYPAYCGFVLLTPTWVPVGKT